MAPDEWKIMRTASDIGCRCYPGYLGAKAHAKLSRPNAFAGLRIHTDEINEVIARINSATLTIAVVRNFDKTRLLSLRMKLI